MHILYIANERRAAAVAARALHATAPQVKVTWAPSLGSGASWLVANRDAAAALVEAEVQGQPAVGLVEKVRALGVTTPILIVAAEASGAPIAALGAGADGYVFNGDSFEADLPRIVTATLERERSRSAAFERKLAELEASREEAEQQSARVEEARETAEQRASELSLAASRLTELQEQHTRALSREARICGALQQRLLDLETALKSAEERRAADAVESAGQLAKRHAEFTASLTEAANARDLLAAKLTVAAAALDQAEQARRTQAASAAAHLARREAELGTKLAEAVAARNALESALTESKAAYQQLQERAALDIAGAADRETALQVRLADETTTRVILEQRVAAAEAARQEAEQRYATELTDAAMRLADVQSRFDAALAEHAPVRAALEQQLVAAAAALRQAAQERESEASAAAAHLARREAELRAALGEAMVRATAFESALGEAREAHQDARRRAAADLAAAVERQATLEDLFAQEAHTRAAIEARLAEAAAARRTAEQQHATEVNTLVMRLADLQARHDAALTEHAAARAALEQQLAHAAAALERATQQHAAEAAAAAAHLARREAEVAADRTALERALGDSRKESALARRRFLHVVSAHRRRTRESQARTEAQVTRERADWEHRLGAHAEEIRQVRLERDTLRQSLATTQQQLQRLHRAIDTEREAFERARSGSESELQRLSAESTQLRQSLDHWRTAFQTVERVAGEHAVERARLESVVAQRDGELSAQAARHLAAEQAAQQALTQAQEKLRQTIESNSADVARIEQDMKALREELDATRFRAEALRSEADQLPVLQMQLEETQKERRREFERAPYALCQCTAGGTITHANHSLVRLLGYKRPGDVIGAEFAATGFEGPDDVRWLFERAIGTGKTETIEARWKTGRRRLLMRLQALATSSGAVSIVVEDVTNVRELEERLRRAHRLEAVGRLASEVAVTCDAVLRDAARDCERWLATNGTDAEHLRQGELLLAEVKRAASVLQRFAVYGDKQVSALALVSVPRVFGDLEPVMKRIVGDEIELVFAALSPSLDVDVEAEHLERIFVNVASYARERMPRGGQVRIEAASTVVGRRFLARYPHARPGPHVLITVAERPRAHCPELQADLPYMHDAQEGIDSASEKPGLEIGALLDVVVNAGGHLWMEAEPAGGLMLKIHLPMRADDDGPEPQAAATPSERGRFANWFRITPATAE